MFPEKPSGKTLLRLSAPRYDLARRGGGRGGVGREAKNALLVLQTLNRIAVYFFLLGSCVFLDFFYLVSWVFLGFLRVSVVSAWFFGFSWVSMMSTGTQRMWARTT